MTPSDREGADARLEAAIAERGGRDPREFYRERLKELRARDRGAYDEAVRYYEETLIPSVASGEVDPIPAWTEYGRKLAELSVPGRTVLIDPSGRAQPYTAPAPPDGLVLHVPDAGGERVVLVGLPAELSDAQRATYDWLVAGRQKLRTPE